MNDIEILGDMLNTNKKNSRGICEIKFEVNSNYYKAIENLIQRNKDLEQILELTSKSLDNISYDQIPIAIEELKFKLQDLEQIEQEHKEENGRLRDRIKELEGIIAFKSKKRKNGTMRYKKTNKLNKYGVNGVCQDMRALKRTGEIKYRAYITLFGKQHTLGTHNTLEEAIQARKDGEKMIENILKNKYKNY